MDPFDKRVSYLYVASVTNYMVIVPVLNIHTITITWDFSALMRLLVTLVDSGMIPTQLKGIETNVV